MAPKKGSKWAPEGKAQREKTLGKQMEGWLLAHPEWTPGKVASMARHYVDMGPEMRPWLIMLARRVKRRLYMRRVREETEAAGPCDGPMGAASGRRPRRMPKRQVDALLAKLQRELIRLKAKPENQAALARTRAMAAAMKAGWPWAPQDAGGGGIAGGPHG